MTELNFVSTIASAGSKPVDSALADLVSGMYQNLLEKRAKNTELQTYYDQKVLLKDLKISLPPQLRHLESVMGWPGKVVDVLADRVNFEGFAIDGDDDLGLNRLAQQNNMPQEFSQVVTSALIQSCAFMSVDVGDTSAGEPDVVLMPRSARNATGIYDRRTRSLSAGMTVLSNNGDGEPTGFAVYLPDETITIAVKGGGRAVVDRVPNPTGRVLMDVLPIDANLERPFGRSRITPAVRTYTDAALRTIVRSEIGAEFFAAPQRYGLGIDPDAVGDKWSAVMSRMIVASRDEDGELPQLGQFPQMSMQPHTDQLRQWASLLAGESSIPMDELGFPSDNPSSDAAIQSQRDPLRLRATRVVRSGEAMLRRLAVTALMLRGDIASPDQAPQIHPLFAPVVHTTAAAAADALVKQAQVVPWIANTDVVLEKLGYSRSEIERMRADQRRAEGGSLIDRILTGRAQ